MKTSLNWLNRYIDIPWPAPELAERLTMAGLEVESIQPFGVVPDGVVVAEILARRPHPNADRLSLCTVEAGLGEALQVVCGAPNCDSGLKVPLAVEGTELGPGLIVKKVKLRGVESRGMLCSARELGLGDDHSGLLELAPEVPVGTALAQLYEADTVIDWEVTPNRPDWLSHIGIAREIAALRGNPDLLRMPPTQYQAAPDRTTADVAAVDVQASDLCPRYIARVLRNVRIGPSPDWMQNALEAVGIRPINNVVDITNYVLMECGQPLHAFDHERLRGHRIVVRRAAAGERMTTLDGKQHELAPDHLVIADADAAVALAGVMGGANSEIRENTKTVLLESAVFQPANIRATSKQLGVSSESSYRFERGVDIEMAEFASRRAAALIAELAGAEVLRESIDVYAAPPPPRRVRCRFERVNRLLGIDVDPDEVVALLHALGAPVTDRDALSVEVAPPPFRNDLTREADLIEEVARLYGLDRIPAEPAAARCGGDMASDTYYALEQVRSQLLGLGLNECMNYSLISEAAAVRGTGHERAQLITLANPLSNETACMRPSLLPGLLQCVAHNVAHSNTDLALFELDRVLLRTETQPEESFQAGLVLSGRRQPERFGAERDAEYDFFDMKGLLEGWFTNRHLHGLECRSIEHSGFVPGASAGLFGDGKCLAQFGQIRPELTADMRMRHPLFAALVDIDALLAAPTTPRSYTPLPQFPAVQRDISLVAPADLSNQAIVDVIRSARCSWLEAVQLFDVYQDAELTANGRRSLAYALTYRDRDETLTDEKVNGAHEQIRALLASTLSVELR